MRSTSIAPELKSTLKQRRHKRIDIQLDVQIAILKETTDAVHDHSHAPLLSFFEASVMSQNISLSGLSISSKVEYPLGSVARINLFLNQNPVTLIATVRRAKRKGIGNYEIGLEFFRLDETNHKVIQEILREHHEEPV